MKNVGFIKYLLIVLSSLFFIVISCEKEVSVDAIPVERIIVGTLVDEANKDIKIADANVTIKNYNLNKETTPITVRSNQDGIFEFQTLLLPTLQQFELHIEAPKYHFKDTVVGCNCEVLNVDLIPLRKLSCGVELSPNEINFGISLINETQTRQVIVSNPTLSDLTIESIEFTNNAFGLDITTIELPYFLESGSQKTFQIIFKPFEQQEYIDSLILKTDCDAESKYYVILRGISENLPCGIQIEPSEIILPNSFAVNDTLEYLITISTIPDVATPIKIDSVYNPFGNDVFYNEDFIGQYISPGMSIILKLYVTSQTSKSFLDSLRFYSSCDDSTFNTLKILGNSKERECRIELDEQSLKNLNFSNEEATFTIVNTSKFLDLSYSISPLQLPYSIIPENLQGILQPLESITYNVHFDVSVKGDSLQNFMVSTNGNCGMNIDVGASYYIPGIKKATIFRWILNNEYEPSFSNPDFPYWGFNFSENRQQPDSISLCGSISFDNDAKTNSNFRFIKILNYISSDSPLNTAEIKVHDAFLLLEPINDYFDRTYYNKLLQSIGLNTFQDGCTVPSLKQDDVIAIKTKVKDSFVYYIMRIYNITRRRDSLLPFEELTIEYFKYAPQSFFILRNNN